MQCLVHSRHFTTHRYRKNWLFGTKEVRVSTSKLFLDPVSCDWVQILALVLASLFFTFQQGYVLILTWMVFVFV